MAWITAPNEPDPPWSALQLMMVALGATPIVPIVLSAAAMMPATWHACRNDDAPPVSWSYVKPVTNDFDLATSRLGATSGCAEHIPPSITATRTPDPS